MSYLRGLNLLRLLFVAICAVIGWSLSNLLFNSSALLYRVFGMLGGVGVSLLMLFAEISFTRRYLGVVGSVLFGMLGGLILTVLFIKVLFLIPFFQNANEATKTMMQISALVIFSYLGTMIVLQSRENFKFIIPFVELTREQTKRKPLVVDTSIIIDGRIIDIYKTGLVQQRLIVPRFVLAELHSLSDSSDKMKRARGRRGLELLENMRNDDSVDIEIVDVNIPYEEGVDDKLIRYAKTEQLNILSNDYNLGKVASVEDVQVINLNDLASALKPRVIPGDELHLEIMKEGEEPGQGVGFLEDGTMVVVEGGRSHIGSEIDVEVTSSIETNAGRMIFAEPREDGNGSES